MEKLKPCPFCGSAARMIKIDREIIKDRYPLASTENNVDLYAIGCIDENCILYIDRETSNPRLLFLDTKDQCAARWNRRINTAQVPAEYLEFKREARYVVGINEKCILSNLDSGYNACTLEGTVRKIEGFLDDGTENYMFTAKEAENVVRKYGGTIYEVKFAKI